MKLRLAGRLLTYFQDTKTAYWKNTYAVLRGAAEDLGEEVYNLWAAFDLLLILGRVERNSPNGREGARVVDWTPVELPLPAGVRECKVESCPVVKALLTAFPGLEIKRKEGD